MQFFGLFFFLKRTYNLTFFLILSYTSIQQLSKRNIYSVAYVSRSGGMSNELNNIISRTTDGVFEGVAIGGDR